MLKTITRAFIVNSALKANYELTQVNRLALNISVNLHTTQRYWFLSVRCKMIFSLQIGLIK